jgi:uncharacterized protein YebE (UPF0316 family)
MRRFVWHSVGFDAASHDRDYTLFIAWMWMVLMFLRVIRTMCVTLSLVFFAVEASAQESAAQNYFLDFTSVNPLWLALAIFLARIVDVSMGTFRTIMVIRGYRVIATAIGFVEVLIWIVAISSVITNLDAWYLIVAYAGGYASGNYIGMLLESRVAIGSELVRAISWRSDGHLAEALRSAGWDAVAVPGLGPGREAVEIVLVVEPRRRIGQLLAAIREIDPEAVYTTSDIRSVHEGGRGQREKMFRAGWPRRGMRK